MMRADLGRELISEFPARSIIMKNEGNVSKFCRCPRGGVPKKRLE
jgi:hypothetical protein